MTLFAILNNGIVEGTVYGDSQDTTALFFGDKQVVEVTETTGPAYVGNTYEFGSFRFPAPFGSWIWDADARDWTPPIAYPTDGDLYVWNEDAKGWIQPAILEIN